MNTTALSAARRARELADLHRRVNPVDLIVIGGGITGTGIALDAASRGLEVVLLEAHDLAFGTSRWSSKLAHCGLRYLASGNVGIAHRSAVERGILPSAPPPTWHDRSPRWCRSTATPLRSTRSCRALGSWRAPS